MTREPASVRQATFRRRLPRRSAVREGGQIPHLLPSLLVSSTATPTLEEHQFPREFLRESAARGPAASLPTLGSMPPKRFVYILRSAIAPDRHYVGLTCDVTARLAVHNSGGSHHTAKNRPWRLLAAVEFSDEGRAARFETYLKSGSGRAFCRRHFG